MQLNGYGGQVFVPLIMVAVLALVYRFLKKIFPENIQMVFVPFFSMLIMIPVTAFLIGPLGIWLGTGLGSGLAWLNGNAPILFAIIIPLPVSYTHLDVYKRQAQVCSPAAAQTGCARTWVAWHDQRAR